MKVLTKVIVIPLLLFSLLNQTCKRELSDTNHPPLACAGPDVTVTLPINTTTLDGSCSTDPDNNITSYNWTKITGPASFNIATPGNQQSILTDLVEGVYMFELLITDAASSSSRDTVMITVINPGTVPTVPSCGNSNRPFININVISIGNLSQPRAEMAVAAAGNKILFAGGISGAISCPACWGTPRVDIYNIQTNSWSTSELTTGRWNIAAIAKGNKIYFAGGEFGDGAFDTYYNNVDIYDISTNAWSLLHLTQERSNIGIGTVGDKILFAGGESNSNYDCTNQVDIYNTTNNQWTTALLSKARSYSSAVTINNKIYFAGGATEDRYYTPTNVIDIFDNNNNSWSTSTLKVHSGHVSAVAINDSIYWSSGCPVEIRNATTANSSFAALSQSGGVVSFIKDNKILFFNFNSLTNKFDIYDLRNGTWSIGILSKSFQGSSVITHNNIVYIAGGYGNATYSDAVYKLDF